MNSVFNLLVRDEKKGKYIGTRKETGEKERENSLVRTQTRVSPAPGREHS